MKTAIHNTWLDAWAWIPLRIALLSIMIVAAMVGGLALGTVFDDHAVGKVVATLTAAAGVGFVHWLCEETARSERRRRRGR